MINDKRLLILGGSGLVGSRIIELLALDYEVIAPSSTELDLTKHGNFESYLSDPSHNLLGGNLTIINFVAYTNVDGAENEKGNKEGLVYRLNTEVPGEIAKWCEDLSNRFIHISTDYVFDGEKESSPYVEEDKTNPLGWYGETKFQGEQLVEESINKDVNCIVLRIAMPYGSHSEKKKDLATILFERLKNRQPIQAIDDAQITPLYIDDFAETLKQLIEQQDIVGLYHVAPADSVTLEQFIRLISKHAKLDDSTVTTISFDQYWKEKLAAGSARRPKHSWLDSTNLATALDRKFNTVEDNIVAWLAKFKDNDR